MTIYRTGKVAAAIGVAVSLFMPVQAIAQAIAVDVELVLAVDVSASIDRSEMDLQRSGYLRALTARSRAVSSSTAW